MSPVHRSQQDGSSPVPGPVAAPPGDARPRPGVGLAQVCAAGVLWGTGGLVVTVLNRQDGLGAMTVSAWRLLLAAATLVALVALTGRARAAWSTLRRRPALVVAVGSGTAAYQGLYFAAVLTVGVSVSTVVSLGLAPLLASTWEHLRARTRPAPTEVAVLGAALAGLLLISAGAGHGTTGTGRAPALGLVLAVAAGVTYAATTVLGHSLATRTDPVALTTATTGVGAVVLLPFLAAAALTAQPVLPSALSGYVLLGYLGVATMALAYGLLYAGLRTTPGSVATVATLVEPLSAALLAVVLLHERLPWPAVVGGALVLGAVVALRPREEPSAAAPLPP